MLDIEANTQTYELTYRQPIVRTPTRELALGVIATRRDSEATLLNGRVPFPAIGAEADGKTHITALRFFQEATWQSPRQVIALRSQFSLGLGLLNATVNDFPPDGQFVSWLGQAQWARSLAPETLLVLRTDIQLADRTLLPSEQFGLGGQDSVRGYRQDVLLADNGIFASAELRVPILRSYRTSTVLQLVPFIDIGTGWNRSDTPNPDPQTLMSAGLGLRFRAGDRWRVRLDWGVPLISVSDVLGNRRTWQENGLYVSVVYALF